MAGKYSFFADNPEMLLALDDDGGCDIADYAMTHGFDEAVTLFSDWLHERVESKRKANEVLRRRGLVRLVGQQGDRAGQKSPTS